MISSGQQQGLLPLRGYYPLSHTSWERNRDHISGTWCSGEVAPVCGVAQRASVEALVLDCWYSLELGKSRKMFFSECR